MSKMVINDSQAGRRLDLILTLRLSKYSRSAVKKLLHQGKVVVNGNIEYRPNYRVNFGDVVCVDDDVSLQRQKLPAYKKNIEVVYIDSHLVVVNKPAGLKVHPTKESDTNSLLNAMYYNLKTKIGEYGINLINRIDSPTSGLVLLAISPTGSWHYAKQFAENKVKKEYLAIVSGNWYAKYGNQGVTQHNFLNYDHVRRQQNVDKEKGDFAHTRFQIIEYLPESSLSLLLCKPISGRTHQIRVQLAHIGFPILGDKKYGGRIHERLMLHSYQINIKNIEGVELQIGTSVPKEFIKLGFHYAR